MAAFVYTVSPTIQIQQSRKDSVSHIAQKMWIYIFVVDVEGIGCFHATNWRASFLTWRVFPMWLLFMLPFHKPKINSSTLFLPSRSSQIYFSQWSWGGAVEELSCLLHASSSGNEINSKMWWFRKALQENISKCFCNFMVKKDDKQSFKVRRQNGEKW